MSKHLIRFLCTDQTVVVDVQSGIDKGAGVQTLVWAGPQITPAVAASHNGEPIGGKGGGVPGRGGRGATHLVLSQNVII